MSEKKDHETVMDGSFRVDLQSLRPVDMVFPEAHRSVAIATGMCASPPFGCGQKVDGFRDDLSAKEYKITGFCQKCQDQMFESEQAEAPEDDDDAQA